MWSLSPWLLDYAVNARVGPRRGTRSARARPTASSPVPATTAGWPSRSGATTNGPDWHRTSTSRRTAGPRWPVAWTTSTASRRRSRAWTAGQERAAVVDQLQALDIEAVPVQDFGDVHDDPQLAARDHFIELDHPILGPRIYERNGFRLSDADTGYDRPGPTLGHTPSSCSRTSSASPRRSERAWRPPAPSTELPRPGPVWPPHPRSRSRSPPGPARAARPSPLTPAPRSGTAPPGRWRTPPMLSARRPAHPPTGRSPPLRALG